MATRLAEKWSAVYKYVMKIFFMLFSLAISFYTSLVAVQEIPITIEFARTPEEKAWGLMQRTELPEDHGMLFIYRYPRRVTFWMFNCYLDLSVAFLDANGTVQEIYSMKAYPDRIPPHQPINSVADLYRYPPNDPVFTFFHQNEVTSSKKIKYALEMAGGWFENHKVKPGDSLTWDDRSPSARIIKK